MPSSHPSLGLSVFFLFFRKPILDLATSREVSNYTLSRGCHVPPPPREANASQLLPTATGPPSRRRRTQMLKPLGWPRRPAPPLAPPQRPDPSLTDPESSEARALRGPPPDSDSDPRAWAARHEI